jgi:hypothetical protein
LVAVAIQKKYTRKAFALHYAQIQSLCDVFSVNRASEQKGKSMTKDDLVDRLLDFLGCPDVSMVGNKTPSSSSSSSAGGGGGGTKKTSSTSSSTGSSNKKAKTTNSKTKSNVAVKTKTSTTSTSTSKTDPFDLIRDHEKGVMPSDDALRQWANAYVVCFDTASVCTKDAIETASTKFGVDLSDKKTIIKELLKEVMLQ